MSVVTVMGKRHEIRECEQCEKSYAVELFELLGQWLVIGPYRSTCPGCVAQRQIANGKRGEQAEWRAQRDESERTEHYRRALKERLERAVPAPHRVAVWERLEAEHPRQAEALASWHESPDSLFLFSASNGQQGNGKSCTAALLVQRLMDHRPSASPVWHTAPLVLDRLRRTRDKPERADELIEELCSTPVLVLDDVGRGKPSVWVLDRLFVVLQSRMEAELVTVMTSNFGLAELDAWWRLGAVEDPMLMKTTSATVVSRIMQMCRLIPFAGRDLRIGAAS